MLNAKLLSNTFKSHFLSGICNFSVIIKIEAGLRVGDYTILTELWDFFPPTKLSIFKCMEWSEI
jgi:hypothetical protein